MRAPWRAVSRRGNRRVNAGTFPAVTIYGVHAGLQHTTMDELRASSASGADGLEQIFLKLTGENAAREFVDVLDA